ncbi:MAG: hypothetical protein E5Y67_07060 [Mesorhizobium sp.]|uniref:AAA family ATPase n=1 Tax=Mesorhizobium sp. TaxID=1871066 RepID=UPI00121AEF42|nr:AAA family ATPase [Mesorhizobium sp.]TIM15500.1 MAG: hypothetical protein E5Y67_07060 [Mesorhizobium sp.]
MSELIERSKNSASPKVHILTSKDFSAAWKPPGYLIDGIFQKRYIYAITARAGSGKTAIALTLAAHVALGLPLGGRAVEKGPVLYFAGENPDDIRTRWVMLAEAMSFNLKSIDVHFIPGSFSIEDLIGEVQKAARANGPYSLVVIDTSAAYFSGEDDNSNVEMKRHAATLRSLVNLPGGPCVLVCSHPSKTGKELPRGGSAFLNEIDGNTFLERKANTVSLKQHEKFRGPPFLPVGFELVPLTSSKWRDARGRPIKSVRAIPAANDNQRNPKTDPNHEILHALLKKPDSSIAEIARAVGIEPNPSGRSKVNRSLLDLGKAGMAEQGNGRHWHLTNRGRQALSDQPPEQLLAANR